MKYANCCRAALQNSAPVPRQAINTPSIDTEWRARQNAADVHFEVASYLQ